jgi:hypothetical protein
MDDENNNSQLNNNSNAQSLAFRLQKKIASKVSNKSVAKIFIDDLTGRILDNLYKLVKEYSSSSKQAESILNDIIKIIVKIGLLFKNDKLSQNELKECNNFQQNFHIFVKSALSFYEVEFTFDYEYLSTILTSCRHSINAVIKNHLTDKSLKRVENVFGFFKERQFLEEVFRNSKYSSLMDSIVKDTRVLLDEGSL